MSQALNSLNIALPPKIHSFFLNNSKAKTFVLYGGRMSGKTINTAKILLYYVLTTGRDALVMRKVGDRLDEGIYKTFVDVIFGDNDNIPKDEFLATHFEVLSNTIRIKKNSAYITDTIKGHGRLAYISFRGADSRGESLRGLGSFGYVFIDEAVEITEQQALVLKHSLMRYPQIISFYCFNPRFETDWVYNTFVAQQSKAKELYGDKLAILKINWYDNTFLNQSLIDDILIDKRLLSVEAYQHHFEGSLLVNTEGAIFTKDNIYYASQHSLNGLDYRDIRKGLNQVAIGVDPAVSTGSLSDLTGIIVCGYNEVEKMFYVLEDVSGKYEAMQWANLVATLYEKWRVDKVIVEGNQGGNMIDALLKSANLSLSYEIVNARYGKHLRAEPIAALYQNKKVKHIQSYEHNKGSGKNHLENLEHEMTTFSPFNDNAKSPDRMDALVYAMTYLIKFHRQSLNSTTILKGFGKYD